jgi:hypothetical protein
MNKNGAAPVELKVRPRLCVIVAGMHRSGTFAVTRVVNLLGAQITRDLLPPGPHNSSGFWESSAVIRIHDRLLEALGRTWDDPFPLPDGWLETCFAQEAQRDLNDEIAKDFRGSDIFVVKDPRIARLLPLWLKLADELGIEPIVVIPVRNPLEVAASLQKRDQIPPAQSYLIYLNSYLETELTSRGRRRLFVRYDGLLNEWQHFAAALAQSAGTSLLKAKGSISTKIDDFLTSELYHNRSSRDELANNPNVAASVVEAFGRLNDAADGGDDASLRSSFDRLRGTLAEATKLFHGLVIAGHAESDAELAETHSQITVLETALADQSSELAAAHSRATALETALADQSRSAFPKFESYQATLSSL